MAASLILACAVRSAERMFRLLNVRSSSVVVSGAKLGIRGLAEQMQNRPGTHFAQGDLAPCFAELVPHGCQHAVAQRHQCRSEPFILGDKPGVFANRDWRRAPRSPA